MATKYATEVSEFNHDGNVYYVEASILSIENRYGGIELMVKSERFEIELIDLVVRDHNYWGPLDFRLAGEYATNYVLLLNSKITVNGGMLKSLRLQQFNSHNLKYIDCHNDWYAIFRITVQ